MPGPGCFDYNCTVVHVEGWYCDASGFVFVVSDFFSFLVSCVSVEILASFFLGLRKRL